MRVVIQAVAARMGGARTHLVGLVPELAQLAPDVQVLLVAQPDLLDEIGPLPGNWTCQAERAQDRGFLGRLLWEQSALPRQARAWGADVLLSFGAFIPLHPPCPTVLEAANALPFTRAYWLWLAKQSPRLQVQESLRWRLLRASLRRSTRVLVPTRAMRQDVVARLPELANRLDVVWWGVSDHFRQSAWTQPEGQVVFGVSKHGLNKEFDVLVRAVAQLRDRLPSLRLDLTGTQDESRWSRETGRLVRSLGIADRVRYVGDLPNRDVPAYLARASLLVYPTWCESFGLPLAEALVIGAPAIAGDVPACREVGGDAARYYQSGSPSSLARELLALLENPADAAALGARARERGAQLTWRQNAEGTLASLRQAAGVRR